MFEEITKWDEKLLLTLNGKHSDFFDFVMLIASNLLTLIPLFLLVLMVAVKSSKGEHYHRYGNVLIFISALFIVSFLCLEIFPKLFSIFFERGKPCLNPNISLWVRLVGEDCNEGNNFFAVRPCVVFCITSFLIFTIRHNFVFIKILLVVWALLVSYSRIYLGAHYPLNVLVADITGILLGFIGSRFYFYLSESVFMI